MTPAGGQSSSRPGFTLVELVLVASVVAVLAAATVPALTMLLGRGVGMEQQATLRAFVTAQRHQAIDTGNVRWLRWEAGGHHLIAGVDGRPADEDLALIDEVELESDVAERLPDRLFDALGDSGTFDASLADAGWSGEVLFYPDGTATPATLAFAMRGRPIQLTVDQWSGAVQ